MRSSVVPLEILHSEVPFEVASFEHFGLERPFNMAAMIVFSPMCPSEGDIYRLERTDRLPNIHKPIIAVNVYLQVYNAPPQFKLSVQMRGGGGLGGGGQKHDTK